MSTSDPDRPADDTTSPETVPTSPDAPPTEPAVESPAAVERVVTEQPEAGAHAAAETPAATAPVAKTPPVTTPTATPAAETTPVTTPVAKTAPVAETTPAKTPVEESPAEAPVVAKTEPVSLDTGRHAVVRPTPVPPADVTPDPVLATAPVTAATTPTPAVAQTPVADPTLAAVAAASVASPPPTQPAPITPEPESDGRLFPDPNAPSRPSVGSHILGVLVGLILTPIAAGVLLLGESEVLEAQVDGWDATTSVFGIVLVTLGLLLLGCVMLLGVWTAAVPITGGAVLTAVGAVFLYSPSFAREQTLTILSSTGWRPTITHVTVAATSGMVIAVGFLLLLAGLVIASARRRGVHLGEFRERHKA